MYYTSLFNSPVLVPPKSSNSVLHLQRKDWKPKINESRAFKLFFQSCWWTYPHCLSQTHLGSVTCIFRTAEEVQFVTVLGAKLTGPRGDWTQNQGLIPAVPEPWRQPVPRQLALQEDSLFKWVLTDQNHLLKQIKQGHIGFLPWNGVVFLSFLQYKI